jgi:hypothetical protein
MELIIPCEFEGMPATFMLRLGPVDGAIVGAEAGVTLPSQGVAAVLPCRVLGYDIARCLEELKALNRSLAGSANLLTFDESTHIRWVVVDPGRGAIALGARIFYPSTGLTVDDRYVCRDEYRERVFRGIELAFGPLYTDQTVLRDVIASLQRFLDTEQPLIRDPWSEHP